MIVILNILFFGKYQSLGRPAIVNWPTDPTACCLLKQASISYLLFSDFKFLKFALFVPYDAMVSAFSITADRSFTIPSIILFSAAYFSVNFLPNSVISLKLMGFECFRLIIPFIPGGRGRPISTSLQANVALSTA